jgi:hypothetical protein
MPTERSFSLRLEGNSIDKGVVSFKLLAGILSGVQDTFHYIGMAEAGRTIRTRARAPVEIQRACELRRIVEQPGSYEVVAEVAPPLQPVLLPAYDLGRQALEKYLQLVDVVARPDRGQRLVELFPDSTYRRRILRSLETYCPKEGDEWRLTVTGNKALPISGTLSSEARNRIKDELYGQETEAMTVTGELVRLHLDEHRLGILYPPTGRVLDCYYDPELEDFIIQNLRGTLQVTGKVQLDANGYPDKIVNVSDIAELDLSPVRLRTVSAADLTLVLRQPLEIAPFLDGQEIVAELPELNIIAAGTTREAMLRDLEDDFVWVWQEYGQADDAELSADARRLKETIKNLVKEVHNATPSA